MYKKKYGNYWGTFFQTQPVFNTCDPDHIKQILGDIYTFQNFGVFFINDKYMHQSLFFANGQKWKDSRSTTSGHFTSRKLKSLLGHFELVANNFLDNVEFLRQTKGEVINMKEMTKYYTVDMIAKYTFAVDIDCFKQSQKNSEFSKYAMKVGEINLFQIILLNFFPKFLRRIFNLNIFNTEPLDKLGDLFKKMLREREKSKKFNDLSELLQEQIDKDKSNMTEDEKIGK